ncbi:Hypothetical predicted protein [Podarcis lilfordi]|uniref:Uncharacterized protein n=1 Tax=Podarcis lilfordi TaxID=74358 RepID=A0AA35JR66_9SAUR|nr:Hypothetical predicted protein [Podarcis lilfordi]
MDHRLAFISCNYLCWLESISSSKAERLQTNLVRFWQRLETQRRGECCQS